MQFNDNLIKISASQKDISKTIEELLEINNLIPKRWNKEPKKLTQKQLEEDDYVNNYSRGEEKEKLTEGQQDQKGDDCCKSNRKNNEIDHEQITEVMLDRAKYENEGRRKNTWDNSKEPVRGHENVAPLWKEVYDWEEKTKKLDKGQLDKKLKNHQEEKQENKVKLENNIYLREAKKKINTASKKELLNGLSALIKADPNAAIARLRALFASYTLNDEELSRIFGLSSSDLFVFNYLMQLFPEFPTKAFYWVAYKNNPEALEMMFQNQKINLDKEIITSYLQEILDRGNKSLGVLEVFCKNTDYQSGIFHILTDAKTLEQCEVLFKYLPSELKNSQDFIQEIFYFRQDRDYLPDEVEEFLDQFIENSNLEIPEDYENEQAEEEGEIDFEGIDRLLSERRAKSFNFRKNSQNENSYNIDKIEQVEISDLTSEEKKDIFLHNDKIRQNNDDLIEAAKKGDIGGIRSILNEGKIVPLTAIVKAAIKACWSNQFLVLRYLIDYFEKEFGENNLKFLFEYNEGSALSGALSSKNEEMIEFLISKGDYFTEGMETEALSTDNLNIIKLLIESAFPYRKRGIVEDLLDYAKIYPVYEYAIDYLEKELKILDNLYDKNKKANKTFNFRKK